MLRTAAMLVATLFSAGPRGWPTSYGEFDTSIGPSDGAALKSESKSGFNNYIYLRSGYYVLKRPCRNRSNYFSLPSRSRSDVHRLVAANPNQSTFVVKNAPLVSFAGLLFLPTRNTLCTLNARAILDVLRRARNDLSMSMIPINRSFGRAAVWRPMLVLLFVVPLGFAAKFYTGPGGWWTCDYGAGVLYELFWILLILVIRPTVSAVPAAAAVFVATCALEFLQLWHPTPLELVRSTFLGRTLIGSTFDWWDFPHYAIGCALGVWVARWFGR